MLLVKSAPLPTPSAQLEYSVGWQKLKDIFKVSGRVSNVEVFTDKSGRSKGTAMVQFEDPGSAHNSIGILLFPVCVGREGTCVYVRV